MGHRALLALVAVVHEDSPSVEAMLASALPWADRFAVVNASGSRSLSRRLHQITTHYDASGTITDLQSTDSAALHNHALALTDEGSRFRLHLEPGEELQGGEALRSWLEALSTQAADDAGIILLRVRHDDEISRLPRIVRCATSSRFQGQACAVLAAPEHAAMALPAVEAVCRPDFASDAGHKAEQRRVTRLKACVARHPGNAAALFTLAEALRRIEDYPQAYEVYCRQADLYGADESTFVALYRRAEIAARHLNLPWSEAEAMYLEAHAHTQQRAEPLVRLAETYLSQRRHDKTFAYIKNACALEYPRDARLCVDHELYFLRRWEILGIAAFAVGDVSTGASAISQALQYDALPPSARRRLERLLSTSTAR